MTSVATTVRFGVNAGKAIKVPCKAGTTADITLSGEQTIDGISCVADDRVLVKDQTDGTENGIYFVSTGTWTRSPDWNDVNDVTQGTLIAVNQGTANAITLWRVATSGVITPGTTDVSITSAGTIPGLSDLADATDVNLGDAMVATKRTESGAHAITVHDVIEAIDMDAATFYEADKTGVAESQSDVMEALTAMSTGILRIKAGTYLFGDAGSGIAITMRPGISIQGDGPGRTIIKANDNNLILFRYPNVSGSTQTFFHLSDMSLLSNTKTGVGAIDIDGNNAAVRCSDIRLDNLYISGDGVNPMTRAIRLDFCANTSIDDVFCILCTTGVETESCADTDMNMVKVQLGAGSGFYHHGLTGATAEDEGYRLTNCSTNGQGRGLLAQNVDFMKIAACSFTTCPSGPVTLQDVTQSTFSNCEYATAGDADQAGIDMDSDCDNVKIIGGTSLLNSFGVDLNGTHNIVADLTCHSNTNVDISITGTHHTVHDNHLRSTTNANSIAEQAGADWNNIHDNTVDKPIAALVGGNSVSHDNLEY